MTNQNENQISQTQPAADQGAKKAYQTPQLTVHGTVNQITQYLLALSHH